MINLRFLVSFLIEAKKNNFAISHFCKGFRWVKIRNIIDFQKGKKQQNCHNCLPYFLQPKNLDRKKIFPLMHIQRN